jgi:hypothetical protein
MADAAPVPVALRKKVLKVLFISLLLDLVQTPDVQQALPS